MADDLNEVIEETVDDATVMTVPIDDTLSISGEAADAKAVGDALALKADKSELQQAISVNGQTADNQGHIIVDATEIEMSSTDTTKVKAAIEAAGARTGSDIPVSSTPGAQTIAAAIEGVDEKTAEDIYMSAGGITVAQKIGAMDNVGTANSNAISELQVKAGDTIKLTTGDTKTIKEAVEERVLTINGSTPDENGNVQVDHAMTADNLTTTSSHNSVGEFVKRTSGGAASIENGDAWLTNLRGNRTHIGYVPESLTMTVTPVPREEGQEVISATIDRDAFVQAVSTSGTINLYYTTSWSSDPDEYGVTVTGEPLAGDQITIVYVKEDRGTIIQSNPQSLVSTGWNLYNNETTYAVGIKYSNEYGFRIDGTYTAVKYSATLTGAKSTITPADGYFTIPANGYIWVEGGNTTDTAVYMTWSDWSEGYSGDFQAYTESVIDLSTIMSEHFPYGMLRVGDIRDEIDLNVGMAVSNVQRLAYTEENRAAAEASGRTYECDNSYIYLERETPVSSAIDINGQYTVSDHGIEYFTDTDLAVYTIIVYGNNLKNKLERDVLTISQQSLTSGQKAQVLTNIGGASAAAVSSLSDQIANLFKYGNWTPVFLRDTATSLYAAYHVIGNVLFITAQWTNTHGSGASVINPDSLPSIPGKRLNYGVHGTWRSNTTDVAGEIGQYSETSSIRFSKGGVGVELPNEPISFNAFGFLQDV